MAAMSDVINNIHIWHAHNENIVTICSNVEPLLPFFYSSVNVGYSSYE